MPMGICGARLCLAPRRVLKFPLAGFAQNSRTLDTSAQPGDLVLAVDGGGTKTICRLARVTFDGQWEVLGSGSAAGSNPRTAGLDEAAQRIATSVKQARNDANLTDTPCQHALLAIAGTLDRTIREQLTHRVTTLDIATHVRVIPDLLPLVALEEGPAIGIIAGTGSVGVGRDAGGQLAIAGGWGPLLGDDGSGFALGKAAIRATLKRLEGGTRLSGLATAVCQHFDASTAAEIKAAMAAAVDPRALVAQLAPVVLQQAQQWEPEANAIIVRAASDLADLVRQLHARLALRERDLPVTVSGGLFQAGSLLADELTRAIHNRGFEVALRRVTDPTELVLAMVAQGKVPRQIEVLP